MQELSRGYLRLDFLKTMIFPEIANQMVQIRISKKKTGTYSRSIAFGLISSLHNCIIINSLRHLTTPQKSWHLLCVNSLLQFKNNWLDTFGDSHPI
jgi:hypothetical protein